MGKELKAAMEDRNKHNREFQDEMEQFDADRELEEAELAQIEKVISGMDLPTDRTTAEITLPGGIVLKVYTDMSPEQEDLYIEISTMSAQARAGRNSDIGVMVNNICLLCASMCAHDPDSDTPWDDPLVWHVMRKRVGLTNLNELMEVISEPFTAKMEEIGKFRANNKR